MENTIKIDDQEIRRLEKILACEDLEKQKRNAYIFFVAAIVVLIWGIFKIEDSITKAVIHFVFSFALFTMGMARLGYYKLFRIIHFQESQKTKCK